MPSATNACECASQPTRIFYHAQQEIHYRTDQGDFANFPVARIVDCLLCRRTHGLTIHRRLERLIRISSCCCWILIISCPFTRHQAGMSCIAPGSVQITAKSIARLQLRCFFLGFNHRHRTQQGAGRRVHDHSQIPVPGYGFTGYRSDTQCLTAAIQQLDFYFHLIRITSLTEARQRSVQPDQDRLV